MAKLYKMNWTAVTQPLKDKDLPQLLKIITFTLYDYNLSPFRNVKSIYSSRVPHKIFAAIFFIICGLKYTVPRYSV